MVIKSVFVAQLKKMKQALLIILIFAGISSQLAAQDSLVLTFTSDLLIDSIRIENLNNGSSCLLKDSDQIVFSFKDESDPDTSGIVSFRQSIKKEPVIYPNPCYGKVSMQFATYAPDRVNIAVYNLFGQQVSQINNWLIEGDHSYRLSFNRVGTHVLQIITQSGTYSQPLVNLAGSSSEPGIEYMGFGNPVITGQAFHKSAFFTDDAAAGITASIGDKLRFSGYAGQSMEMFYDFLDEDSTYNFTFPSIAAGVYLQLNDTLGYQLDTIHCFATRQGYLFSNDSLGSLIFDRERIFMQPVTFGGTRMPVYSWEIGNPEIWMLDTSTYLPGVLIPIVPKADTSVLTLHDQSNNFTREFVIIMDPDDFVGNGIAIAKIQKDYILNEISGMAASVKNPGCFWVHNDSGDEARIFLINTDGKIVCTVTIDTDYYYTDNRDWEDIAVGPGPVEGETYIYIGEIGDLDRKFSEKYIFRVIEPEIDTDVLDSRLRIGKDDISTITFDYEDGYRDAEILMIDPLTKDLFIVTKREERVQIYELSYPQNYEEKVILTKSPVTLPFRLANGGDISADGQEILIKNLKNVYYWKRREGESIQDALARPGEKLPYIEEPQGEAIAWFRDGSAYLTVSEKKDGITPVIYKYIRRW
jgi:hypothetical protein